MSKSMPAVPVANRSKKGPGDPHEAARDTSRLENLGAVHASEQGDTANIQQNTTNEGQFRGRRMK